MATLSRSGVLILILSSLTLPTAFSQPADGGIVNLQAAADEGQVDAQLRLARAYAAGRTVPRDRMMAYVWYNLAASQGSEDAGTERDKLSRLLTGPEVAQAEALSRDWRPKEVLETPSLRALFNEQLQQLIASAETKAGFAWAQTTKRTTTPNRDIEAVWETEVRFPGASSKPCDVTVVSQAAREAAETFAAKVGRRPNGTSPWISCVVFSSEDSVRAAQFFTMLSQQLWDLVPEDWLRPPPLRGVQSFESVSYSAPRSKGPDISLLYRRGVLGLPSSITLMINPEHGCGDCGWESKHSVAANARPPATDPLSKPSIQVEIEAVERDRRYVELPGSSPCQPDPLAPVGVTRYQVKNSTAYDLRVILAGPSEREIDVAPNSSQAATLPAGTYKILGKVSLPSVLPFLGTRLLASENTCGSEFYIK